MLRRSTLRASSSRVAFPSQTSVIKRHLLNKMSKPVIAVMGATGAQGGSVVDALMKSGKWNVRGITRDPKSAKAEALRAKGVEVVKANAGNKEEIEQAFKVSHFDSLQFVIFFFFRALMGSSPSRTSGTPRSTPTTFPRRSARVSSSLTPPQPLASSTTYGGT